MVCVRQECLARAGIRAKTGSKPASQKLAGLGYMNIVEFGGIRDWEGEIVK